MLNQIDFINSNLFTGSGLKHLQKNDFKKFKFKLPEEKPEQTRIAQILSKADAAIAQTEALIAKYQRIKTGLMQDLLTCGIDEHGNIRSKATHRFVVKNGIEVPEEWEVDCLATLIKAVDAHPSHRTPPSVENGIPYLGISDIDEYGNIDLKKCRKVSLSVLQEHNNRYQLRDGDIIFGKIGTIGEPKRLKAWREVTISANVILIQPHNTPGFIFWVLNSDFIKTQVKNTIHSTTQPAFGMEKIRTLIIPFPPKPEREQIEKILNKSEDNLISTRIRLYKLQSLKIGLMQDLLAGKVRVKIKEELA
ncbi:MAG: restriction endonuclease subunit S [Saprospiraceae bacterium]|nr:restriction endonuclease subunit S [Saprospiraceae bacterium]